MRITIVAIGSTGDVGPYLGVGSYLAAHGHHVTVATHDLFRGWVEATGLQFELLPMDPRAQLDDKLAAKVRRGGLRAVRAIANAFEPWVEPLAFSIDGIADRCDLLLLSALGWTGLYSAHLRNIPVIRLHLQPLEPTRQFPPPALGVASLGGGANLWLGRASQRGMHQPYFGVVDELRRRHGGVQWSHDRHRQFLHGASPVLHGYSPRLSPRPHDWPSSHQVVGYWPVPAAPEWDAGPELVDFLAAGPAPVYFGFGSTRPASQALLAELVVGVVERTGIRAVVDGGWAEWAVTHDNVFNVAAVHHRWLFPQMSAVVHHAGAGTTASALVSGVPSVPVPVSLDQPFWARRLRRLGVASHPIGKRQLTVRRLADSLAEVQADSMRAAAITLRQQVGEEHGLRAVLDAVNRASS
jgi:sterol 3beta-glucosyltransferase